MATGITSVVANLEKEFETARKDLEGVDSNIKRITGREPGRFRTQPYQAPHRRGQERDQPHGREPDRADRTERVADWDDRGGPRAAGPRRSHIAFSRINRNDSYNEDSYYDDDRGSQERRPTLASSVVTRPVKPRTEAIQEQSTDTKSMARHRRMFGALLGTLKSFENEERRRQGVTQKRVEIEKKVEQVAQEEKDALVKERKELFKARRQKQAEMRKCEQKIERAEIHQEWEKSHKFLGGFIRTKAKPFIFYMPKRHNPETEKRLQDTKDKYRLIVAEKRARVQKELDEIDELYKKEVEEEDNEFDDENEPAAEFDAGTASSDKLVSTTVTADDQMSVDEPAQSKQDNENGTDRAAADGPTNGAAPSAAAAENQEELAAESLGVKDTEFEPIYDE